MEKTGDQKSRASVPLRTQSFVAAPREGTIATVKN
jgi:hypothetical protein